MFVSRAAARRRQKHIRARLARELARERLMQRFVATITRRIEDDVTREALRAAR